MSEVARGVEVENLINSDACLKGFIWSDDGVDLNLAFDTIAIGNCKLKCTWASGVNIMLDSKQNVLGMPLTREVYYKRLSNGRFKVKFDFADRGCVDIECEDLILRKIDNSEEGVAPNS